MRGKPKPRAGSGLNAWRSRQEKGAIMKPETFEKIKASAKKKYGIGEERAEKVAGAQYWKTAEKKFKKHGAKTDMSSKIVGECMKGM